MIVKEALILQMKNQRNVSMFISEIIIKLNCKIDIGIQMRSSLVKLENI